VGTVGDSVAMTPPPTRAVSQSDSIATNRFASSSLERCQYQAWLHLGVRASGTTGLVQDPGDRVPHKGASLRRKRYCSSDAASLVRQHTTLICCHSLVRVPRQTISRSDLPKARLRVAFRWLICCATGKRPRSSSSRAVPQRSGHERTAVFRELCVTGHVLTACSNTSLGAPHRPQVGSTRKSSLLLEYHGDGSLQLIGHLFS
jgi:hypothetical protein